MRVITLCGLCKHLHDKRHWRDEWTCDAFPAGIPERFIRGFANHTESVRGDGGIVFEPKSGVKAEGVQAVMQAVEEAGDARR